MKPYAKQIRLIVTISLSINIILTVIKLTFGYLGGAHALVSDGFNSLSDIMISLVMLVTLRIANKKPDFNHPYGHEKFEGITYLLLGLVVSLTAVFIIYDGIQGLISYFSGAISRIPDQMTMYVAGIAMILKLGVSYLNYKGAKKYHSVSLKADFLNHLTDLLSIGLALLAIILAQFSLVFIDYIAGIIIGFIVTFSAIKLLKDGLSYLVDQAPSKDDYDQIYHEIKQVDGVVRIDDLKIRQHVLNLYVDVEIAVNRNLSLKTAHQIAENVHEHIENVFDNVLHIMVHVNPDKE